MEAAGSFKTVASIYETIWCHIPEAWNINTHCWEKFKSNEEK
jgi:hypothetical protein